MEIMIKKVIITLLLSVLLLSFSFNLSSALDKSSEAENCYQQALKYYEQGKCELAIENLKKALKFNKKLAKAYNQLALVYMDDGSVYGRFKATIELEKALKLEPKNVEFLFNQAMLNLKKGFTRTAERQFKKITEFDPANYSAYYQLALLKEEEMLHYQDMISVAPGSDGIIFMDSFARKLHEQAADYYKMAIAVNPKFSDVYYRLALIYYEFDNYEEMIQLLESAVKIIPDDKNCHLFLGFAYQIKGRFDQAASEYQMSQQLMATSEKEALESIEIILTPEQKQQYALITDSEKHSLHKAFWTSKDPFYLTEFNERELEHFSRIAYANLRFSRPEKKTEGWDTDRGKVFIRYGKPNYKYRTRPYIGEFIGNGRNPLQHSKEIWIYPDFHFIFEDQYLSGNYDFAWGDRPGNDYKEIYEDMIEDFPDYYKIIPDSQFFNVPYDIVAFMGQNGRTELELCFTIPANELNIDHLKNNRFKLLQGIFFFDGSWNPIVKRTKELTFASTELLDLNFSSYYHHHENVDLKPGDYYFALEFQDEKTGKRSRIFRDCQVDTFVSNQFQMSDILFAYELEHPNLNVTPARSDFKIIPNPQRLYPAGQPIVIYFEIYNLAQDQNGETHFSIEYRIGQDMKSMSSIKKLLTGLKLVKKSGEVTTSYEYTGNAHLELQYQKISLEPNMSGKIGINVRATDLSTGSIVERQETLTVMKQEKKAR